MQAAAPGALRSPASERTLLANASQMAQTYYNDGNFEMARRLLDSLAVSYRHEGWRSVLTTILLTALDCAMRMDDRVGAVQYSLELLGANLLVTPQQKQLIMSQLMCLPFAALNAPPATAQTVLDTVFEVDRRHAILQATSHFATLPIESPTATVSKDASVCVGEEFDLILSVAVGFPVDTHFQRMDVYFYCPTSTASGTQLSLASVGAGGGAGGAAPYHLVLLPGGPSSPVHGPDTPLSQPPSDQTLPVLRPDPRGHVHADLSFPAASLAGGALTTPKTVGASSFTFGVPPPAFNDPRPRQAIRSYRIRMKATVATISHAASSALGGSVTSPMIPGANSSLFPTSLVCALGVPAPVGGAAPKALQFRADILPSKLAPDEARLVPVSVVEARAAERAEAEKKAKKKGLTLPPDVQPPQPTRAPTLRILPPHARARIDTVHPPIGLIGEYMPIVVRVRSEGDELRQCELTAAVLAAATTPGLSPSSAAPSPAATPAATPRLTPSGSMESVASARSEDASAEKGLTVSTTIVDPLTPAPLSRSSSHVMLGDALIGSTESTVAVKLYRLAAGHESVVGLAVSEPVFEEVPSGPLTLPTIAPGDTHDITIYVKSLAHAAPTISFTLAYQSSTGQRLSVVHVLGGSGSGGGGSPLVFKSPFKIKTKLFADALSGLAAPTTALSSASAAAAASSTPQRLILAAPTLCHVELENMSGAALRIDQIALELSGKFFAPGPNTRPIRECVSPAASRAIQTTTRLMQERAADGGVAVTPMSTASTVCLAPGEKYTHLFHFVPIAAGKTRYAPLHVRWNRITPYLLPAAVPSTTTTTSTTVADSKDVVRADSSPFFFATPSVASRKELVAFHILRAPLSVTFRAPPSVVFGASFRIEVRIANETDQLHDVELHLLEADGGSSASAAASTAAAAAGAIASSHTGHASHIKLVLSGRTRCLLRIRPHTVETVLYTACPLECGILPLPRIQLKAAGLTTMATNANALVAANPTAAAAANSANQSVLLVDPSDTGVIFVHPRSKQPATEHRQTSDDAIAVQ